ncbi:hypothetical protein J2X31_002457 [Flavobacterium arsenatis]|uniref:PKD domain-containing protein n=1 Tax=Flavobacterium arsenatis TaxID=1484332 RepID=A0ABU1TRE7_9FLAO|nr:hypothetical protein [Flavobacterium arsenatis]MDR6968434.1 hypothetical protein [Flavobacterium arsenatis]
MRKFYSFLIVFTAVFIFSCEKPEPECFLTSPQLYVNGVLYTGQPITVEVLENENITIGTTQSPGFEYQWTGPNGFESNLANPIIINASNGDSGIYNLRTTRGICTTETSLDLVVNATVIPCTPQNNKLTFTASVTPMSFYGFYNHAPSDYYTMVINSSQGDLTLRFSDQNPPESGVYPINSQSPTSPGLEQVSVAVNYNGYYGEARTGEVYLTKLSNEEYKILFCDFKFFNGYPIELIGSALINQNEL